MNIFNIGMKPLQDDHIKFFRHYNEIRKEGFLNFLENVDFGNLTKEKLVEIWDFNENWTKACLLLRGCQV